MHPSQSSDPVRPAARPRIPVLLSALAFACGVAMLSSGAAAAEPTVPEPLDGFDAYVRSAVEEWEVPGLAVAVVEGGETVFARGYGVLELGGKDPVDPDTLFAVGSTTKALTAASLGMLVDEGELGWDDPVIEHLPWFRVDDPWLTRELTVRDLLTHRGGLGNTDSLWYEQDTDTREILERMRFVGPAYSPRSGFVYQNVMYAAAGEVLAAVSGRSWHDFVRTRILEPVGMERTVTTLEATGDLPNVAAPHDLVDDELTVIQNASVDPVAPAGSIWSSVHDMGRWLAFLLRGCVTEAGERLLEEATCEELFTPQVLVGRDAFYPTAVETNPRWTSYGLGWFQHDYEGRKVDFHTGSIDGMVALAGLLRPDQSGVPEGGLGVYVLANRDHAELRHALMYRVFDLYDPDAPRDWSAELRELYASLAEEAETLRTAREAERVEGTSSSLPPGRYAGVYTDPLFGRVKVEVADDGGLRLAHGRLTGALEHWHHDTFRVIWDARWRGSALVNFLLDAAGEPTRLEVGERTFHRRPDGPAAD